MRVEAAEETWSAPAAARALAASGRPWFWLDGEAAGPGEPRVSLLGIASEVREAEPGREREFLAELREAGESRPERGNAAGGAESAGGAEPAGGADSVGGAEPAGSAAADAVPDADAADSVPGAEGLLAAGWVVAFGYEFGVALLGVSPLADDAAPAVALRCDAVLAVDHERGESRLRGQASAVAELQRALDAAPASEQGREVSDAPGRAASWRSDSYEDSVTGCLAAISRGDAYVLCLTDTAEAETSLRPLELYERIRGGALRGGVIVAPGRALVSASPERFLSVRGRSVATHPIKGTRPRGTTDAEDARLAADLRTDPKERAENLMIVDLMRNDLTRVCEPGSVRVDRFLSVESHPRVHQLVSSISGRLRGGADAYDAIESCFPGGSMTGAPKRSAVGILAALEVGPRGLYSGCFGWISDAGDAELAMTIRGVELRDTGDGGASRALVGAGGGITADSDPARERAERDLKAAAMLANLPRLAG